MAETSPAHVVHQCFERFRIAYQQQNYGVACDAMVQALKADAGVAYPYFITRASAAMRTTLVETGKAAEIAAWLDGLLPQHPHMNLVYDGSPEQVQRVLELRTANIARGLPSIVLVTLPKSASVSVARIFNSGFNLPSFSYSLITLEVINSWARDYARGGACYTTHLEPYPHNVARLKRAGIGKIIVHVRDPRQHLLSLMHHMVRYPDDLPAFARHDLDREPMARQINRVLPFYVDAIRWIQGWIDAEAEIEMMFSTFESFVVEREAFIERYIEFYGGPRDCFSYENAVAEHVGTDYHFRSGQIDEWQTVFPAEQAKRLSNWLPAELKHRFGWRD